MPWRSAQASLNAVRGCYGAADGNPAKRAKCRKMAHEARLWRGNRRKGKRKPLRRIRRATRR